MVGSSFDSVSDSADAPIRSLANTACSPVDEIMIASASTSTAPPPASRTSTSDSNIFFPAPAAVAATSSAPPDSNSNAFRTFFAALRHQSAIIKTAQLIHEFPEDRLDLFDRTQIERAQNPSVLALCGISGLYVGVFSAVQKFPRSAKWLDRVENWWEQRAMVGMEKKAAMGARAGTTSTGLGGGAASASMDASSVAMSAESLKVCKSAGLLGRSLARQLCAVGPSLLAVYVYGICTSRGLIETFCADRNTALGVECSNKYKELAREDWEAMGGGGGN